MTETTKPPPEENCSESLQTPGGPSVTTTQLVVHTLDKHPCVFIVSYDFKSTFYSS